MVSEFPTLETTVAEIAERWPAAREVLSRRGIDSCCGGAHALAVAARAHGQDPAAALAEILAAVRGER